jgi:hypothetical protein
MSILYIECKLKLWKHLVVGTILSISSNYRRHTKRKCLGTKQYEHCSRVLVFAFAFVYVFAFVGIYICWDWCATFIWCSLALALELYACVRCGDSAKKNGELRISKAAIDIKTSFLLDASYPTDSLQRNPV